MASRTRLNVDVVATENLSNTLRGAESSIIRFVGAVSASLATLGAVFFPIASAKEFDLVLRDVQKTTGFSTDEVNALGDSLLGLSSTLKSTAVDLGNIAASAGQLGLGVEGTGAILSFTESVARASTTLDLLPETAANDFAKLSNIFQLPISEVEKLISTVNELSNTTVASADQIINVAKRIGNISGLLATETAALSATALQLGVAPEVAGTSLVKVFTNFEALAPKFAKSLNTTVEAFLDLSPIDRLRQYLQLLNDVSQEQRFGLINSLSGSGRIAALVDKLAGDFANGSKILNQALDNSTRAYDEGTSALEEYQRVSQSLTVQLGILVNQFVNIATASGLNVVQNQLIPAIKEFQETLRDPEVQQRIEDLFSNLGDVVDAVLEGVAAVRQWEGEWQNIIQAILLFVGISAARVLISITGGIVRQIGAVVALTLSWRTLGTTVGTSLLAFAGLGRITGFVTRFGRAWDVLAIRARRAGTVFGVLLARLKLIGRVLARLLLGPLGLVVLAISAFAGLDKVFDLGPLDNGIARLFKAFKDFFGFVDREEEQRRRQQRITDKERLNALRVQFEEIRKANRLINTKDFEERRTAAGFDQGTRDSFRGVVIDPRDNSNEAKAFALEQAEAINKSIELFSTRVTEAAEAVGIGFSTLGLTQDLQVVFDAAETLQRAIDANTKAITTTDAEGNRDFQGGRIPVLELIRDEVLADLEVQRARTQEIVQEIRAKQAELVKEFREDFILAHKGAFFSEEQGRGFNLLNPSTPPEIFAEFDSFVTDRTAKDFAELDEVARQAGAAVLYLENSLNETNEALNTAGAQTKVYRDELDRLIQSDVFRFASLDLIDFNDADVQVKTLSETLLDLNKRLSDTKAQTQSVNKDLNFETEKERLTAEGRSAEDTTPAFLLNRVNPKRAEAIKKAAELVREEQALEVEVRKTELALAEAQDERTRRYANLRVQDRDVVDTVIDPRSAEQVEALNRALKRNVALIDKVDSADLEQSLSLDLTDSFKFVAAHKEAYDNIQLDIKSATETTAEFKGVLDNTTSTVNALKRTFIELDRQITTALRDRRVNIRFENNLANVQSRIDFTLNKRDGELKVEREILEAKREQLKVDLEAGRITKGQFRIRNKTLDTEESTLKQSEEFARNERRRTEDRITAQKLYNELQQQGAAAQKLTEDALAAAAEPGRGNEALVIRDEAQESIEAYFETLGEIAELQQTLPSGKIASAFTDAQVKSFQNAGRELAIALQDSVQPINQQIFDGAKAAGEEIKLAADYLIQRFEEAEDIISNSRLSKEEKAARQAQAQQEVDQDRGTFVVTLSESQLKALAPKVAAEKGGVGDKEVLGRAGDPTKAVPVTIEGQKTNLKLDSGAIRPSLTSTERVGVTAAGVERVAEVKAVIDPDLLREQASVKEAVLANLKVSEGVSKELAFAQRTLRAQETGLGPVPEGSSIAEEVEKARGVVNKWALAFADANEEVFKSQTRARQIDTEVGRLQAKLAEKFGPEVTTSPEEELDGFSQKARKVEEDLIGAGRSLARGLSRAAQTLQEAVQNDLRSILPEKERQARLEKQANDATRAAEGSLEAGEELKRITKAIQTLGSDVAGGPGVMVNNFPTPAPAPKPPVQPTQPSQKPSGNNTATSPKANSNDIAEVAAAVGVG